MNTMNRTWRFPKRRNWKAEMPLAVPTTTGGWTGTCIVLDCHHRHKTQEAAESCARSMRRKVFALEGKTDDVSDR